MKKEPDEETPLSDRALVLRKRRENGKRGTQET
jgi:hypothetical protein